MEFLPLGTVVKLKEAQDNQKAMITGRASLMDHEGVVGYFDYVGVAYPQGQISTDNFFFNTEDIDKIYFEGYKDNEQEQEFQIVLAKAMAENEYPKFNSKDF